MGSPSEETALTQKRKEDMEKISVFVCCKTHLYIYILQEKTSRWKGFELSTNDNHDKLAKNITLHSVELGDNMSEQLRLIEESVT